MPLPMTPTITAFAASPDRGQGLARDTRVRSALEPSGLLDGYSNLSAYVARAETRPAYKRAFAAQLAVYTNKPPTS